MQGRIGSPPAAILCPRICERCPRCPRADYCATLLTPKNVFHSRPRPRVQGSPHTPAGPCGPLPEVTGDAFSAASSERVCRERGSIVRRAKDGFSLRRAWQHARVGRARALQSRPMRGSRHRVRYGSYMSAQSHSGPQTLPAKGRPPFSWRRCANRMFSEARTRPECGPMHT